MQKLSLVHLRDICEAESLSASGTRAELIARLLCAPPLTTTAALSAATVDSYEQKAETRVRNFLVNCVWAH